MIERLTPAYIHLAIAFLIGLTIGTVVTVISETRHTIELLEATNAAWVERVSAVCKAAE